MSRAGKPKGKNVKRLTAEREEETRFTEDSADAGHKTKHGKSLGPSVVPRGGGGDRSIETSSNTGHGASAEGDQLKKKDNSSQFKGVMSSGRSSSKSMFPKRLQSRTSSLAAVDDGSRQSEEIEVYHLSLKKLCLCLYLL